MKRLLLFIALLISGLGLNAQDATIGDLEFTITSEDPAECAVSGYSGEPVNVIIPSKVTISGKEFSVTVIGKSAFLYCGSLTSIEIPSSVTSIGILAFSYCANLTSIVVESGNTVYDSRNNCNAIIETATNTLIAGCQNTVIPNAVTSIGGYAFAYCSSLTSIEIPSGVTSIGDYAFSGCSSLTSIIVENGNTVYDSRDNCNAIIETATNTLIAGCQNTVIPNTVTSIGDGAYLYSSLTSIEIPSGVTSIGNYAFSGSSSLTSIEFEENSQLTSIGNWAFSYCSSLTSIEIPSGVTSIGGYAFAYCSLLTSIYCYAEIVPETGSYVFASGPSARVIYVPAISVNAYKATSPWNKYTIMPLAYVVTASSNPEDAGVITGTGEYTFNDAVTLKATANEGYKFVNWTEDGEVISENTQYSFVIIKDRNLVANFELINEVEDETTCIITAVANPEEAGTIKGTGTYVKDMAVKLTAVANEGYEFLNWTENDIIVSIDAEYLFEITKDRNLVANFEKIEEPEVPENPENPEDPEQPGEGVEELTSSFNIYPNPVSDMLFIETEVEIEEVSIFDIYGRRQELSVISCQLLVIS